MEGKREGKEKKKIALVLGGGGITGGVYIVGALCALDDFMVNRRVTDLDIYIGVSSGAMISSLLAVKVTPDTMFQVLNSSTYFIERFKRSDIYRINYRDILRSLVTSPYLFYSKIFRYLTIKDLSIKDTIYSFGELLPAGLLDNKPLQNYLHNLFVRLGKPDDFRVLDSILLIPAVNLDKGDRVVFGEGEWRDVPISKAVRASATLPGLFKPTRIGASDYIDGAVEKNLHLDLTVRYGAELVLCINPIVPLKLNPLEDSLQFPTGTLQSIGAKGLPYVLDQVFRMLLFTRFQYGYRVFIEQHPELPIILFQPERTDSRMFFYNAMRYSARLIIAMRGYETTKKQLLENFDRFRQIFGRVGVEVSTTLFDSIEMGNDGSNEKREGLFKRIARLIPFIGKKDDIRNTISDGKGEEEFQPIRDTTFS